MNEIPVEKADTEPPPPGPATMTEEELTTAINEAEPKVVARLAEQQKLLDSAQFQLIVNVQRLATILKIDPVKLTVQVSGLVSACCTAKEAIDFIDEAGLREHMLSMIPGVLDALQRGS